MPIAQLTLALRIEAAQSLKDRRQVLRSLKDRLREGFNVSVAELDPSDLWQTATVGVVAISSSRDYLQGLMQQVEEAAERIVTNHGATIIFIDAPFELLRTRIENSSTQRPLARDPKRLRELYEQRRPIYQLAHHTFQSSESDPSELLTSMVQLAKELGVRDPARDKL